MSIIIKGMKMPKDTAVAIVVEANGDVCIPNEYWDCELLKGAKAVELPDHGDLIEKDPLFKKAEELEEQASAEFKRYELGETNWEQTEKAKWRIARLERIRFKHDIADALVVIPAERSEE